MIYSLKDKVYFKYELSRMQQHFLSASNEFAWPIILIQEDKTLH